MQALGAGLIVPAGCFIAAPLHEGAVALEALQTDKFDKAC